MVARRLCLLTALALLPTLAAAQEVAKRQAEWPQWRGPDRNGLSSETGLLSDWEKTPPKLEWMSEGMGSGYASLSVSGNRIFTTGNFPDGQAVLAVDAADGSVVWKTSVTKTPPKHNRAGSRSTPTIDGDRVYIVASSGAIVCLNNKSGAVEWSKEFSKEFGGKMMSGWGYSESPLVDGEWVLCTPGGRDAMIVALNKVTGDEVWRSAMPRIGERGKDGAAYSSIVVSNAAGVKQYVQLVGRGLIGVRASDGKFLWGYNEIANRTANVPTPIPTGDYVFCSTGYGTGAALVKLSADGDGIKAEEQYFLDGNQLQNHHGGMLLIGDYIYCGHKHNNGLPICVRLKDGEVAWGGDFRGTGEGSAAIVYADGHIIFRYQNGKVALIEATPKEYRLKGVLTPEYQKGSSWAQPVVAGGKLYLREQDKLMCYELKGG
jgi:outer membrane protein assembly factor BamB